jgi:hypothetical protein
MESGGWLGPRYGRSRMGKACQSILLEPAGAKLMHSASAVAVVPGVASGPVRMIMSPGAGASYIST